MSVIGDYIDLDDVQRATSLDFVEDDYINETGVKEIVLGVEARVNAVLRYLGYSPVPLTNADDILVIKELILSGVIAKVLKSLPGDTPQKAKDEQENFDTEFEQLRKGHYKLESAHRGDNEPHGPDDSGWDSEYYNPTDTTKSEANRPEPLFTRDEEF